MEDTTIEDVLKTVETLYAQKDYEKALEVLNANEGRIGPGIWHYNMGTIYGKLENLPMARFHLLMAEKKGFSAKEMINNRELIESKLEVDRLEKPLSASDYVMKYSMIASSGILTMMSLFLIVIGLYNFWKRKSARVLLWCLIFGIALVGVNTWIKTWNRSIVIEPQGIHEGPSAIFAARDELPKGVMVITNQKGEWLEIIYPSRFHGWIKDSGLKELR